MDGQESGAVGQEQPGDEEVCFALAIFGVKNNLLGSYTGTFGFPQGYHLLLNDHSQSLVHNPDLAALNWFYLSLAKGCSSHL